MLTSLILSIALTTNCDATTCRTPVRTVVAKTKAVVVERQPVRSVTTKAVVRVRVRDWRILPRR